MKHKTYTIIAFLLAAGVSATTAQTGRQLAVKQNYSLELKRPIQTIAGAPDTTTHVIKIDGAPWLRVHIADFKLQNGDHITITSLKDRSTQKLDELSLANWRNNSAFFNGDSVNIRLVLVSTTSDSFVRIKEVTVGTEEPAVFELDAPGTICGANDDRTSINDPPVGRLNLLNAAPNVSTPFCTAWAVSNGTFLTAGHCIDFDANNQTDPNFLNGVVEFNVPSSQPNGTTVFSNANDQYPTSQWTWQFGGSTSPLGLDWGVFSVSANSNTGLVPHPSRGFYRMTDQIPTANSENVRVSGYGQDNTPAGTTGGFNAQNATLQTHTGTYQGQTQADNGTYHSYSVDTTPGASGSPIVWSNNSLFTIGIHTDGGCTSTGGSNAGTGFGHDQLETAIQTFWGPNTIYVDSAAYPNLTPAQRDGSIFRPHSTLANGVNGTVTGGNLMLVPNTYTGVTTFNRAMTIRAPAGTATILP